MSNFSSMGSRPTLPTPPQGDLIGRYATYEEAQRAVDFLSDEQFPVQNVTIVGTDLKMVERVTGRLTYARAAGAGAASGAWFGLFVGVLMSVFGQGGLPGLATALLIGQSAQLEQYHWFIRAHLETAGGELTSGGARTEQQAAAAVDSSTDAA